ncbi:TetR family transcriptional regulator [Flavobacteriaceae bacterium KMM 6897]|nr:TetR family transcriptional regulator [Flavobacteriaceae bacterium KMM 6897]MEB8345239.1 TetR family transcriptional regulator [Flavobacteriaceae bacterium KMM 6898]
MSSKKEKFFEVSLKLIHEKGYKATTMRDIAEKLNFKVANVYNYIDSKQALLESYLFDISNEFLESIELIIDSPYGQEEKLRMIISVHIQMLSKKPYELSLLVNEWRNLDEPKRGELIHLKKKYNKKVRDIIISGMDQGLFRTMDPDIATLTFLSSLRWLYDRFTDDSNEDAKANRIEIEKQLTDFIFLGLGKH